MPHALEWLRTLTTLSACARLLLAALLAGLIGNERGRHGRAAGMRTHILVCVGAALTMLVGQYAAETLRASSDPLRLGAQVISGIGFLGAGTILIKDRFQVTGLTTAAGLWATASIGLALGIGYVEAAAFASLLVLSANAILPRMERKVKTRAANSHIYAEIGDPRRACALSELLNGAFNVESLQFLPARSGVAGRLGVELEFAQGQNGALSDVCRMLMQQDYVVFAAPIQ